MIPAIEQLGNVAPDTDEQDDERNEFQNASAHFTKSLAPDSCCYDLFASIEGEIGDDEFDLLHALVDLIPAHRPARRVS